MTQLSIKRLNKTLSILEVNGKFIKYIKNSELASYVNDLHAWLEENEPDTTKIKLELDENNQPKEEKNNSDAKT